MGVLELNAAVRTLPALKIRQGIGKLIPTPMEEQAGAGYSFTREKWMTVTRSSGLTARS